MILYFLQHGPLLVIMEKTHEVGAFVPYFNTLAAFLQVLIQGRQLSILDTFMYCQTIALSQYQNKKRSTCVV